MSAVLHPIWATRRDNVSVSQNVDSATTSKMYITAWAIEIACILIGLMLAVSAGMEASTSYGMMLAAASPFAAAAIVELGRIPLVRGFFYARGLIWRSIALLGVLLVGSLTFENLMFGFERAFSVRIEAVRAAGEISTVQAQKVADQVAESIQAAARRSELQRELASLSEERSAVDKRANEDTSISGKIGSEAIASATSEIARLDKDLSAMLLRHAKEISEAYAYCKARDLTPCNALPFTRQANERKILETRLVDARKTVVERTGRVDIDLQKAREARTADLTSINSRMQEIQKRLDAEQHLAGQAAIELNKAQTQSRFDTANTDALRRTSQMHRLAAIMFGSASDDHANLTLGIFATIAAAVLALAGSVLAAIHYRIETQALVVARPSRNSLVRAIRKTLARLRRGKPIERRITVEKIVEVPVERRIVVEKIVEVPVEVLVGIAIPITASVAESEEIIERTMRSRAA